MGDCSTCMFACCCPCCLYGKNKARLDGPGSGCCGPCCTYSILSVCGLCCCVGASTRAALRGRFSIAGGFLGDCFSHMCCAPCALTQEKRELDAMNIPIA